MKKIAALPVTKIFPAHHDLNVPETILSDMENAFMKLNSKANYIMEAAYINMVTFLSGFNQPSTNKVQKAYTTNSS